MKKLVLALILIAVLGGGGYYLWDSDLYRSFLPGFGDQPVGESSVGVGEPNSEPELDVVGITVEGKAYSFTPSTIIVSGGDKVRLTFKNTGNVSHDFAIQDLDVNTTLVVPGDTQAVEFTVPLKVRKYEFICTVPGHKEAGMVGTISIQ